MYFYGFFLASRSCLHKNVDGFAYLVGLRWSPPFSKGDGTSRDFIKLSPAQSTIETHRVTATLLEGVRSGSSLAAIVRAVAAVNVVAFATR